MLKLATLLDDPACARLVDTIHRHEARWTSRSPTSRFFTFGAASYLDEPEPYLAAAHAMNPLLRHEFGALYDLLRQHMAELLGAPVSFAEGFALPGFHIWGVPGIPTAEEASLHFDLQYDRLPWPERARSGFDRAVSFTLPLRLPRRGGGLSLWNVTWQQVNAFYLRTGFAVGLDDLTVLLERRHQPYTPGELVLHSGHTLHRIAPTPEVDADDERITLQGHGLFYDGEWKLYW